jgi:hypothetical protein
MFFLSTTRGLNLPRSFYFPDAAGKGKGKTGKTLPGALPECCTMTTSGPQEGSTRRAAVSPAGLA